MTRSLCTTLSVTISCVALNFTLLAADDPAGYVDFGKLAPSTAGGEFVEVNIKNGLISMVARLAQKEEPEVAEVLRGLKQVRVNVIQLKDDNRAAVTERVEQVRTALDGKGWERIVTAKDENQDVGIYVKTRGDEAVEGVVVTVLEGDREAVLINIVGDIKPEQLAMVGERFDIEPLKKAKRPSTKS